MDTSLSFRLATLSDRSLIKIWWTKPHVKKFTRLLQREKHATRIIIDPAVDNIKAVKAYQKAGFEVVDKFIRTNGYFAGIEHYLMLMKLI